MTQFFLPPKSTRAPELLIPGRKPAGVEFALDRSNPLGNWIAQQKMHAVWVATPAGMYDLNTKRLVPPSFTGNVGSYTNGGWENAPSGRVYFDYGLTSLNTNLMVVFGFAVGNYVIDEGFADLIGFHESTTEGSAANQLDLGTTSSVSVKSGTKTILTGMNFTFKTGSYIHVCGGLADAADTGGDMFAEVNTNSERFRTRAASDNSFASYRSVLNIGRSTATNVLNLRMAFQAVGFMPDALARMWADNPYQILKPAGT